jgi:hypothetical protein
MGNSIAILVGSAIVAAAVVAPSRWEMAADGGQIYRLDRWTGAVVACNASNQQRLAGFELRAGVEFNCVPPKLPTLDEILGPPPKPP